MFHIFLRSSKEGPTSNSCKTFISEEINKRGNCEEKGRQKKTMKNRMKKAEHIPSQMSAAETCDSGPIQSDIQMTSPMLTYVTRSSSTQCAC